jgi:hypothetical protein
VQLEPLSKISTHTTSSVTMCCERFVCALLAQVGELGGTVSEGIMANINWLASANAARGNWLAAGHAPQTGGSTERAA